jgi:hypothetical protein
MVDPIALNLPICAFIEVRLHTGNDAQIKRFERMADQRPDVSSCWRTSGDADYLLHGFVADPLGYERLLNAFGEIDGVEIVRTHLVLSVLKRSPRFPLRIQSALCLRYCNHVNLEKLHDVARRTEGASKGRSVNVFRQVNTARKR